MERKRLPDYLKRGIVDTEKTKLVRSILKNRCLNTVCEAARCPNKAECYAKNTATFLILGNVCTRNCRFCNISGGTPQPPDPLEPQHVAQAIKDLNLKYAVITSVTRDDLPLQGADVFRDVIIQTKKLNFSLCLYGQPGTGKSEYAKHLAKTLGIDIVTKKASEILDMYVGGTEENIANAFSEAKKKKAMLIFDEADTFLQNRNSAQRRWEISQVNEMLTQMEDFEYPFVCTTNLFDTLDEASLRRFTFKIKFDFLTPTQIKDSFKLFFKQTISDDESNIKGLTIGDFATVKKKNEFLGYKDKKEIIDLLIQETEVKHCEELKKTIGF